MDKRTWRRIKDQELIAFLEQYRLGYSTHLFSLLLALIYTVRSITLYTILIDVRLYFLHFLFYFCFQLVCIIPTAQSVIFVFFAL